MWSRFLLPSLLLIALLSSGCARAEEVSISPLPTGDRSSSDLGAGIRPLSYGPGYKGSPSWSPDGERIAYVVDGYVVDKPLRGGEIRRWTARDFGASKIESNGGQSMMILGQSDGEDGAPGSLYRAVPSEGTPEVSEVTPDVLTAEPLGNSGAVIAAIKSGPGESTLALVRGEAESPYGEAIEGEVTGFSVSPDRRHVVLAVIPPGEEVATELRRFGLLDGSEQETIRLGGDRQIFGAPQWTRDGVYYVAGAESGDEESSALYGLYRVPPGSDEPEAAPGVGSDFAASSIQVSPDRSKLAIVGRFHANAPTNLHVLDLETGTLRAATSSEDMEIKNGPRDVAWAPDGESVAIVAKGSFSIPRVRGVSADNMLEEFYNLYEVPVSPPGARSR